MCVLNWPCTHTKCQCRIEGGRERERERERALSKAISRSAPMAIGGGGGGGDYNPLMDPFGLFGRSASRFILYDYLQLT